MNRLSKTTGVWLLIALFLLGALAPPGRAWAGEGGAAETRGQAGSSQVASAHSDGPGPVEMMIDGFLVRPLSLVMTVVGTVAFVATLPFSALGGNIGDAAEQLVVTPAAYTFTRCLGCWRADYKEAAEG